MTGPRIKVSVLLSTFNRLHQLEQTLRGFTQLRADGPVFELIIVDNDAGGRVRDAINSYADRLPLVVIQEPARGKNRALNKAVALARGDLFVFTDDDVQAEPDWLLELSAGARRHPGSSLFGGRILPLFPAGQDDWLAMLDLGHWFIRSAYVIGDWNIPEGPTLPQRIWGPNMMVRRQVFDAGHRFDARVGPDGTDYAMGGETEFLRRMAALGHRCTYLPGALVRHRIEPVQMTEKWLMGRAFRMGRGHAAADRDKVLPRIGGVPRYLWRDYAARLCRRLLPAPVGARGRLIADLEIEILRGSLYQFRKDRLGP